MSESAPRHWKDWPGLLNWSMQYQDGTHPSTFVEMDDQRREWLAQALKDLSKSELDILIDQLKVLVDCPEKYFDGTLSPDELKGKETALQNIADIVDNLDNAQDFIPLGGFEPILGLLDCKYPSLQKLSADVIGIAVQNHPKCQQYAMEKGAIETFIKTFQSSNDPTTRVSIFGAISCLIRGGSPAFLPFLQKDGLDFLISVFRSSNTQHPKLIVKSAFLLSSILQNHEDLNNFFVDGGIIEILIDILKNPTVDWLVREPCLWLLSLISATKSGTERCKSLGVFSVLLALRKEVEDSSNKEALQEVIEYLDITTRNVFETHKNYLC
jgi:hypothetical protein